MEHFLIILGFMVVIITSGCVSDQALLDSQISMSEHNEEHENEEHDHEEGEHEEQDNEEYEHDDFHIHADFKVYIDNEAIDFSIQMYQLRDESVHVEDGIGEVIHVHKRGITVGDFFETLGIGYNTTCISIPLKGDYCNGYGKELRFFVNGAESNEFEDYEIREFDKILVSFGKEDIQEELDSVTNYSLEQKNI